MEPSAPNVSLTDIAYIAGFFDGEGHIRIQRHSTRCKTMMLQCTACQAEEEPLTFIQERFGGTVKRRTTKYKGQDKVLWEWQVSSKSAERFLDAILPYMRCKYKEALIALAFRFTFAPQHVKGGHKKISDEVLAFRESCKNALVDIRQSKRVAEQH